MFWTMFSGVMFGSGATLFLCTLWLNREARDWKKVCDKHWEIIEELESEKKGGGE